MTTQHEEHTIPSELAASLCGGVGTWVASTAVLTNIPELAAWHVGLGGSVLTALAIAGVGASVKHDDRCSAGWKTFTKVFTGLVGLADTAWLTWGQATGHPTTPMGLLALGVGTAVTWFGSAQIIGHLDRQGERSSKDLKAERAAEGKDFWDVVFQAAGLSGIQVIGAPQLDDDGELIDVLVPPAMLANLFVVGAAEKIAAAVNAIDGTRALSASSVLIVPSLKAGRAQIRFQSHDMLADDVPFDPDSSPADFTQPFAVAKYVDGSPVMINLFRRHAEIVGGSQAGKSSLLNVILSRIFRCRNAAAWIGGTWKLADLVGAWVEGPMREGHQPPMDWVAANQQDLLEQLASMFEESDRRLRTPHSLRPSAPTEEWPALVAVIDEASRSLTKPDKIQCHDGVWRNASDLVEEITRGSAGEPSWCHIILATQRGTNPDYGAKGGDIKTNLSIHFMLRTDDPNDLYRVLPGVTSGLSIANLEHAGTFYLKLGKLKPILAKAQYLARDLIPRIAIERQYTCGFLPREIGERLMTGRKYHTQEGREPVLLQASAYSRRWHNDADAFLEYLYTGEAAAAAPPKEQTGPPYTYENTGAATTMADLGRYAEELAWRQSGGGDGSDTITSELSTAAAQLEATMRRAQLDAVRQMPESKLESLFSDLTADLAPKPVPEPLRTLLERFGDREFVSTADLAGVVGMDSAALGRTLQKAPFEIKRRSTEPVRRKEYRGEPVRGYFVEDLKAVAEQFRDGTRSAE